MDNKNLKEKVITPITDALTKLTDNVSSPVNAVGLIPENLIPKIEWPRDYTLADYACEKIIERIIIKILFVRKGPITSLWRNDCFILF